MIDLDTLTTQVTAFWNEYEQEVMLGGGLVLAAGVAVLLYVFWKTERKYMVAERIAILAVLGWTSEGMWKIAVDVLDFPHSLALMTFFVAEALMFAAAGRAKWHNEEKGDPGPYGALVWCFAAAFGTAVAFNEITATGFFLRILLPVAVTWLWWTGLTIGRSRKAKTDDDETQWAWTPRDLLVRFNILKPGKMTATDSQKEFQIRRMVEIADKAAAMKAEDDKRAKLLRKLRKLTRTADDEMVVEVAERVARASQAAALMVPGVSVVEAVPLPAALTSARVNQDRAHDVQAATDEVLAPVETQQVEQLVERFRVELEQEVERLDQVADERGPADPEPGHDQVNGHANGGGVEHPTMEVQALPEPLPVRTHSAAIAPVRSGLVRAVASVPSGPTGRTLFYSALAEQLRQNDLRVLSGNSRTRNEAGYEAAASVDGELVNGTVRKYVKDFRQLLGLTGEAQGGEEHRAVALEQFPAPVHTGTE